MNQDLHHTEGMEPKPRHGYGIVTRDMSAKGGKARVPKGASMLTPEERKAKAQKAAQARWAKNKSKNSLDL